MKAKRKRKREKKGGETVTYFIHSQFFFFSRICLLWLSSPCSVPPAFRQKRLLVSPPHHPLVSSARHTRTRKSAHTMEEVSELVEVADAVRHQFASADDAAKLAAAAAVTSDLEALCASRETDARAVIDREWFGAVKREEREERERFRFLFPFVENDARSSHAPQRKNNSMLNLLPAFGLPLAPNKKKFIRLTPPPGLTRVVEAETAAAAPPPEAAAHGERLAAARARAAEASAAAAAARASAAALRLGRQQAAEQRLDAEAAAEAAEALAAYEEPRMRAALSLFVNISSVAWQMGSCCLDGKGRVVGTFGGHKPSRLSSSRLQAGSRSSGSRASGAGLRRFEFDEENTPRFDLVNSMWDMIGR